MEGRIMIKIDDKQCNTCGICIDVCPNFVFLKESDNNPGRITPVNVDLCCNCGHCVIFCPRNAIIHENISDQQITERTKSKITVSDIEQLMMARRSIRCFKPEAVPEDKIESLIRAAANAGTASNMESEEFIVIQNQEMLKSLEEMSVEILWNKGLKYATDKHIIGKFLSKRLPEKIFSSYKRYHKLIDRRKNAGQMEGMVFRNTPCLIVISGFKAQFLSPVNCTVAARNIELLASGHRLGTCWAGMFITAANLNRKRINDALQIDQNRQIFGALMVGYPKYRPSRIIERQKKDIRWL